MNKPTALYTWEKFLDEWGERYQNAKHALKMIRLYPERLHLVYLGNIIDFQHFDANQKNRKEIIFFYHTKKSTTLYPT